MDDWRAQIGAVVAAGGPLMHFQPIVDLAEPSRLVGYEALARFPDERVHQALNALGAYGRDPSHLGLGPDVWFAHADLLGLGLDLELSAIRAALAAWSGASGLYLAVNASPDTVLSPRLPGTLDGCDRGQLLVELTEHFPVTDYAPLVAALHTLRSTGCGCCLRLAIDDWGAGEATYRHVLELAPDVVKIDVSLTAEIDHEGGRAVSQRAIVRGLVVTAATLDSAAKVVAEGVERETQAVRLRELGVDYGQGWHFGRPGPLPRGADA